MSYFFVLHTEIANYNQSFVITFTELTCFRAFSRVYRIPVGDLLHKSILHVFYSSSVILNPFLYFDFFKK